MHNLESVLENETHKRLWDFEIQTGSPNLGQTIRPSDCLQNYETEIPILIGALGTIPEGLVKWLEDLEIRGQVETIPNNNIIKVRARIL